MKRHSLAPLSFYTQETIARPYPPPVHEVSTSTQGLDNDEQKTSIRVKTLPHAYEDSVELHDDPLPEPVPEPLEPETDPGRSGTTRKDRTRQKQSNMVQDPHLIRSIQNYPTQTSV
jgi:hypothetical protein